MNLDELTLGQIKQLRQLLTSETPEKVEPHHAIGKHVIIRTYSAGVHFGILRSVNKDQCVIDETIRIWKWAGAFSLSQLSVDGPKKPDECKFDHGGTITLQWIEILECTPQAIRAIKAVPSCKV